MNHLTRLLICLFAAWFTLAGGDSMRAADGENDELALIVMDPLAAPLACDCVKGYAQRKYERLGEYLSSRLQRPVKVYWGGGLKLALEESEGRADLIIGKHSVVLHDSALAKIDVKPIASLTATDGSTTQTGLIVVRAKDRAKTIGDLKGYRIFFGTPDAEEKSAAIMAALRAHEIEVPTDPETCDACSGAATKLLELDAATDAAAVISSYAKPLLEGCGTIKKGDLRVVAETAPVPFVSAFANEKLSEETVAAVRDALLAMGQQPELLQALETQKGFVPFRAVAGEPNQKSSVRTSKKKN